MDKLVTEGSVQRLQVIRDNRAVSLKELVGKKAAEATKIAVASVVGETKSHMAKYIRGLDIAINYASFKEGSLLSLNLKYAELLDQGLCDLNNGIIRELHASYTNAITYPETQPANKAGILIAVKDAIKGSDILNIYLEKVDELKSTILHAIESGSFSLDGTEYAARFGKYFNGIKVVDAAYDDAAFGEEVGSLLDLVFGIAGGDKYTTTPRMWVNELYGEESAYSFNIYTLNFLTFMAEVMFNLTANEKGTLYVPAEEYSRVLFRFRKYYKSPAGGLSSTPKTKELTPVQEQVDKTFVESDEEDSEPAFF